MACGHFHMEYDIVEVMKLPHVEDKHEEGADSQVPVKNHDEEDHRQALIEFENKDEGFLHMGEMV